MITLEEVSNLDGAGGSEDLHHWTTDGSRVAPLALCDLFALCCGLTWVVGQPCDFWLHFEDGALQDRPLCNPVDGRLGLQVRQASCAFGIDRRPDVERGPISHVFSWALPALLPLRL